jgi:ubiquinone/menaquinone biosynthesis C-methylase UbiE
MSAHSKQPSPEHFFETVNAYQRTAAIKTAIELDLFTAIGEGKQTTQELAQRCAASERGIRILSDYMVILGFLIKENGRYALTADTALFLDRRSPAYLGGATEFLLSPMQTDAFENLTTAVRRGGTAMPEGGSVSPENPVWVKFARAMAPMMAMPARAMAEMLSAGDGPRPMKVLDIAAGHGLFGISIAQQNSQAEVFALDWPSVLEVAKENAGLAGVTGRYHTIEGSAFEADYGEGYDVVLLTNFLHHFDPQTCEGLLRRVHAALKADGRALTLEFVPNDDRISPAIPASFSMTMLGATPGGDAYTFAELERMFASAGFAQTEIRELPASPEKLLISRK